MRGQSTVVYCTHRWNITAKADRILLLENGELIEQGTHAELTALKDGKYAKRE